MIDPSLHTEPEVLAKQESRHEQADSVSKKILEWYKGDAHTHSQASTRPEYGHLESQYSRREVMNYYQKLGLEFVTFAEHSTNPGKPEIISVEHPISQAFFREAQEVTELNRGHEDGPIALSGTEANIVFDSEGKPEIDLPPEVLKQLDLVIGSRHAIMNEKDPAAIKESLLYVAQNPNIDVLGHPDRYTRRDGETDEAYWAEYNAIWPDVVTEAAKNNKAIEINLQSQPSKELVRLMVESGVPLFINFDAHDFHTFKWEQTDEQKAGKAASETWGRGEATEEDMETIQAYKADRLSHGPGTRALLRMARWIKELEALGVTPERVVNSSKERLLHFLTETRGKRTPNLEQLTSHE